MSGIQISYLGKNNCEFYDCKLNFENFAFGDAKVDVSGEKLASKISTFVEHLSHKQKFLSLLFSEE